MKNKSLILAGFMAIFAACSCNEPKPNGGGDGEEVTVLPNHEIIYELNVRNYSPAGNFAGVTSDIARLKELGVDILWLMPIHPIGVENRKGVKGSPYSVKNYLEINPDYGTATDLKNLVAAAHKNGMKIIIDWVANHTAWDNVWVSEHIDFYAVINGQRPAPAEQDWTDVVKLDYSNPELRSTMIEAMKYWVQEFDIDGYRCDYTYGVPANFWQEAITEVNAVKKCFFLSEGDDINRSKYFDCDYAWGFSNRLLEFAENQNVAALKNACTALFNNSDYADLSRMVYITNHDLNAYHGTEFTRFGGNTLPMTALFFTIYDMPLLYNGQEIGANKSMGLFDVEKVVWQPVNSKIKSLIKKLIDLKHSQPALENGKGRGELTFYATNNANVLVYSRKKNGNEVLVVLNFNNTAVEIAFAETAPSGEFANWLESGKTEFSLEKSIMLAGNGYQIFVK
ncbi:MAG: alpha-glucosidase C-terminal domain-containing protein [Prevotellaceae bacterium]|jgi:glycosidase|nr:alpha-glucosidase C-terminal domain-containing protein [Prevotellaceae bacterium]